MTPFTLRPVPRAVLDWLAIAGVCAGSLVAVVFAILLAVEPTWGRGVVAIAGAASVVLGAYWFTDVKHRASRQRESERRSHG